MKRLLSFCVLFIAAACGSTSREQPPATGNATLFEGARLITGDGSAPILKLERLGGIAPGKSADFIVLTANPLEDITNTRRIDRVYLRGMEIDRGALRASWSTNGGS
jgi:cytosine/adenosine deaminase-related metal-dependent hydrolase